MNKRKIIFTNDVLYRLSYCGVSMTLPVFRLVLGISGILVALSMR